MSNHRVILKALGLVGIDKFYDMLDGEIAKAVNDSRKYDYDALILVVANRIVNA